MSTPVLDEPQDTRSEVVMKRRSSSSPPDLSVLQDRLPEWLKFPRVAAAFAAAFGGLFFVLSYPYLVPVDANLTRVAHTDVWGHLSYARWMISERALPTTEPLMPLAEGVPFVDTAWLSQLIGYGAYSQWGVVSLVGLHALGVTFIAALLAIMAFRKTGRLWFSILGSVVFLAVCFHPLQILRPQLAGMVCFAALLALLVSGRRRRWDWFAVPALFALWANLHGSFSVGLATLGLFAVGQMIDVWRRDRFRVRLLANPRAWRGVMLLQLGAAAALLNPYGLALYAEVLSFGSNPNLLDLVEWDPLTIQLLHGQAAAVVVLALAVVYRLSPRRIAAWEVLLLSGLGGLALWHQRMIVWWAPVAGYCLALHLGAIWNRNWSAAEPSPRGGLWTVATLGLCWIFFAYTPLGLTMLHGGPQDQEQIADRFERSVSAYTPIAAVDYLKRNPPQGQVFNTYEWGDYLLWAGPAEIEAFVNSHAHLVPEDVWRDYMSIAHAAEGWSRGLDRYSVNTVLLDKAGRGGLIRELREHDEWTVDYEDRLAVIFVRKSPI